MIDERLETKVKVIIDGDACPVVRIVETICKEEQIPVLLLCDTSHEMNSDYSEVITVGKGQDAVDFMIIQKGKEHDVVVTQDFGVAAMSLGKGMYAIHQSGKEYTNENIDLMLFERHIAKEIRGKGKSCKKHSKGPKKRTQEDNERFTKAFRDMIKRVKN